MLSFYYKKKRFVGFFLTQQSTQIQTLQKVLNHLQQTRSQVKAWHIIFLVWEKNGKLVSKFLDFYKKKFFL